MWRLLGKSAHLWPEWFYKLISKIHSKIIRFNHSFLGETATKIINEVPKVSRVVYDITSKPPGTIEWE